MPEEMSQIIKDYAEDMSSLDQWMKECVIQIMTLVKIILVILASSCISLISIGASLMVSIPGPNQSSHRKLTESPHFQEVKKVEGYIRYRNVTLNDIGDLCYHKAEFDDNDFAKRYQRKWLCSCTLRKKEQADSLRN